MQHNLKYYSQVRGDSIVLTLRKGFKTIITQGINVGNDKKYSILYMTKKYLMPK